MLRVCIPRRRDTEISNVHTQEYTRAESTPSAVLHKLRRARDTSCDGYRD
jgi:hypothetical protein